MICMVFFLFLVECGVVQLCFFSLVCRCFLCLCSFGVNFLLKFLVLKIWWILILDLLLNGFGYCLIYLMVFFREVIWNIQKLVISLWVLVKGLLIIVCVLLEKCIWVFLVLGCSFLLVSIILVLISFLLQWFIVVSSFLLGILLVLEVWVVLMIIMNFICVFFVVLCNDGLFWFVF